MAHTESGNYQMFEFDLCGEWRSRKTKLNVAIARDGGSAHPTCININIGETKFDNGILLMSQVRSLEILSGKSCLQMSVHGSTRSKPPRHLYPTIPHPLYQSRRHSTRS